jgi:hypothetical protein
MNLADAADLFEALDGALRNDDGDCIEDNSVAPADLGARDEAANALLDRLLLDGDPRQPSETHGCVQIDAVVTAKCLAQSRLAELDHDFGKELALGCWSMRTGQRGHRDEKTDP